MQIGRFTMYTLLDGRLARPRDLFLWFFSRNRDLRFLEICLRLLLVHFATVANYRARTAAFTRRYRTIHLLIHKHLHGTSFRGPKSLGKQIKIVYKN